MGSFRHPKQAFDPLDLEIMERALDAAWAIIKARQPLGDQQDDEELRTALSEKLISLAETYGVTDSESLRSLLLGEPPASPSPISRLAD
jgi:hypothetical protein